MQLIDRSKELELLEGLLSRAEEGYSAAVVLRGEAGVGKTALLDAVAARAAAGGVRIAQVTGVESEVPLGYAALHRLLLRFPELVDRLPPPQRDALLATFGLISGPPPDRFLVALAVLTMLAELASAAPLLCIVDDAQWLDVETMVVLGFVARRLHAERVVMLFAVRELSEVTSALRDVPELCVGALAHDDASALLSSVTGRRLDPYLETRLLAESGGNPLALVELASALTPEQMAGSSVLPEPLLAAGSLQQLYLSRLRELPADAQLLLAVVSAEPAACESDLWRAAERLGVDAPSVVPELTGLVTLGAEIRFRHPLVRTVAYHNLPAAQRQRVHRAVAEAMQPTDQPDRVAWHLAMAARGPDEAIATQLERAAGRAGERGGYAAATAFLARAADLSGDRVLRIDRLLAASEGALISGQPDRARALLEWARSSPLTERQSAAAMRLEGEACFAAGHTVQAAGLLLASARSLLDLDPALGRSTLLTALTAANFAGREALQAVRALATRCPEPDPADEQAPSVADCFLFGFLHRLAGEHVAAAGLLRRALAAVEDPASLDSVRATLPPVVAAIAGNELLDERASPAAMTVYVEFARRAGAPTVLPMALTVLSFIHIRQGRFDEAEVAGTEAGHLAEATGAPGGPDLTAASELSLLCWRGREAEARALAAAINPACPDEDPGHGVEVAMALGVLELGLGRYREAFEQLEPVFVADRVGAGTLVLHDLIEAAARCDETSVARLALERLAARASAGRANWGLACLARSRALLAPCGEAEPLYREAVELSAAAGLSTDLARNHLVLGEWLRRRRRRRDARVELTAAYRLFSGMGAELFAERARAELEATGEHVPRRSFDTTTVLTPQEAQVARLAAEGATNREIAAQLFVSPATVDYHLRKVFQKLAISSRTQLIRTVAREQASSSEQGRASEPA